MKSEEKFRVNIALLGVLIVAAVLGRYDLLLITCMLAVAWLVWSAG